MTHSVTDDSAGGVGGVADAIEPVVRDLDQFDGHRRCSMSL
jgi:hypothetical protein